MGKFVLLIIVAFFTFSCAKTNNIDPFLEIEKMRIYENTSNLLQELGFSDYTIKIHHHKSIGNFPSTRTVRVTRAVGDGLLPLIESAEDRNLFRHDDFWTMLLNDFNGHFEQRTTISNYDHSRMGNTTITFDYISVLIIFDYLADNQRNELLKILNMHIGNTNRGDTIFITSRRSFGE
ncbi:MAG: hypothetical protein FWC91_12435 [Defluviitaleaceae bacterium]|nr:hypothetical protein [Defluviitaleaceae bacterium]